MKVKAIPIKSKTLCGKCQWNECCNDFAFCSEGCGAYVKDSECACVVVKNGEPCRHFKRSENTLPKITNHGFFVDKCKCGGNISVLFGFSCTGKPMSILQCDNCHKAVHIIGNIEKGKKFIDIWEGADNG